MSLDSIIQFKEKIHRRWGDSPEIATLLALAGMWNRAVDDGWTGEISLRQDIISIGGLYSVLDSEAVREIICKWVNAGLLKKVDSDRYFVLKSGFASPVFFDI